ncbi:hypothetical protein BJ875DRAFT_449560 [Amylocarpus encephaloides]|uniref:Homoaconitase, mitochondrial n=1 Tax=Amylocarpus encephaloides TaxID=45428 RepID=A0A9P8C9L0_9HELO|nr:hypothetical protein BJ875DRAFT_449560 [Amylocarpus encephaloides]
MLMSMHSLLRIRPQRLPVRDCRDPLYRPVRRLLQDAVHSRRNHALFSSLGGPRPIPQTLTEKIVQRHSLGLGKDAVVKAGDFIALSPSHCMTHDNSWPVAAKFLAMGASKIHSPRQIVCTLDHDIQNTSETNLMKYRRIEDFARAHGVDFYPAGRGIGHQIMVEEGYAWPGTVTVASDSHSNMYGGVGCLGTPVVRTDAASIWATGKTWWQIPPIAKCQFTGVLPVGVTGKDVIVALCGLFNNNEVLNHAIEFTGSEQTMRSLSIDDRLTIANMTTEWGALSGLFPIDSVLLSWLRYKATTSAMSASNNTLRFSHSRIDSLIKSPLVADRGASYAKSLYLNLSTLSPYVAGPNSVKVATPVHILEAQHININKAYLVSCTNSRASDIAAAAKVFKDAANSNTNDTVPKIAPGVHFYIAAASLLEQEIAEEAGDWEVLLAAGAKPLPSGCGPCIGLGTGLLESGEVGISASNRNFKGRMGSPDAKAYLASPEVVAASALRGYISGPESYNSVGGTSKVILGEGSGDLIEDKASSVQDALEKVVSEADMIIEQAQLGLFGNDTDHSSDKANTLTEIIPGFPERVTGEIVFCDADNLNTDIIYPGKYTYQDNVPLSRMAEVCMENYDRDFHNVVRKGDILVSGFNFGNGSSREQAATAILASGIPLVIAGSFNNIFSRNSINNALLGIELPRLVERLRECFASSQPPQARMAGAENGDFLDKPTPVDQGNLPTAKVLTRRTGWTFVWDVRKSRIVVKEGTGGVEWSQDVAQLPPNVQEIIARGGLEGWVRQEIGIA